MGYNYDVLTNTLSATKGFFDRASRVNTTEYNLIKKLRADNPGMTIKQRPSSTRPHHNITFAQMEHYIAQFPQNRQKNLMNRYTHVRALSKTHASPYKYVLDWFNDYFPHYNDDMIAFDKDNQPILKTKDDSNNNNNNNTNNDEIEKLDKEMEKSVQQFKDTISSENVSNNE